MKAKNILLGFGVFFVLSFITFYWTVLANPAYEDRCTKLMTAEFDYEITDYDYVNKLISCQNYFDGHPIVEYWSDVIAASIFWLIVGALVAVFKESVIDDYTDD